MVFARRNKSFVELISNYSLVSKITGLSQKKIVINIRIGCLQVVGIVVLEEEAYSSGVPPLEVHIVDVVWRKQVLPIHPNQ